MSTTIPHSSAIAAPVAHQRLDQQRDRRTAVVLAAIFLAIFVAEVALVIALAPTIDALGALAPLG